MVEINLFNNARTTVTHHAGDVIFSEGDEGRVMYAVLEGEVALSFHGAVVETVGPGGIFGELALIDHAVRSGAATALVETRVAVVDEKEFVFLVQEHPRFSLLVMQNMAERLRRRTAPPA